MRGISIQIDADNWVEIPEPGHSWSAHDALAAVSDHIPGAGTPSSPPQGPIRLLESARRLGRSVDVIWRFVLLAGPQASPALVEFRHVGPEGIQRMVAEVDREAGEGRIEADPVHLGHWVGRRYGRIHDPERIDLVLASDPSRESALYGGLVYLLASEAPPSDEPVGICISLVTTRLDLLPLIVLELEARIPTLTVF